MQELAAHAFELMKEAGTPIPHVSTMPVFEDLYRAQHEPFEPLPPLNVAMDDPVMVMHSSGTSPYPHY